MDLSPQNIFGDHQDVFWQMWDELWCSFWFSPLNSTMDTLSVQSLSYCWIINSDHNWGEWGLQFFRCAHGRPATHGKVHQHFQFSPCVEKWFSLWFAGIPKPWKWLCDSVQADRCQWPCLLSCSLRLRHKPPSLCQTRLSTGLTGLAVIEPDCGQWN